jgi:hypothetical protein
MKTTIKTIVLSSLLTFFGLSLLNAQTIDTLMVIKEEPTERRDEVAEEVEVKANDTTVFSFRKRKIVVIEEGDEIRIKSEEKDWDDEGEEEEPERKKSDVGFLALDLGITNYHNGEGVFGPDANIPDLAVRGFRPGSHVALHFLPTTASLIGRGVVNLKTALTIDYSNYYFQNDITLQPDQDFTTIDTTGLLFSRNKLTTRYFQVPLMLNFNTDPWGKDGVSISVGVYGGVLWGAKTKQVSDELGKVKTRDDFNLNPWRYGVTGRIDFKWFDIYATYNLSELFAEGEGPSTQTFTIGLNLFDF